MSLIEDIRGRLARTGDEIADARSAADEAHDAAEQIADRAAAHGFLGIAEGMDHIRDAIDELRERLATLADLLDQIHRPVDSAPARPSPEQAITALTPAVQHLGALTDLTSSTVDEIEDTQRMIATVLDGGEPGPMIGRLDTIRDHLERVLAGQGPTQSQVENALAEAKKTGDPGDLPRTRFQPRSGSWRPLVLGKVPGNG